VLVDPGVDDKRLCVIEQELFSVLRAMHRDGNTLSTQLRQAFDSGEINTLAKNNPATATGAHVSVIGQVTPSEVRAFLAKNTDEIHNGFWNRFLFTCVRRVRYLPMGGGAPPDLSMVAHRLRHAQLAAQQRGQYQFDAEARRLWETELYRPLVNPRGGVMGSVLARGAPLVARLALVYALADMAEAIGPEHLRAAMAVWRYSVASARFVFGEAMADPMADAILIGLRDAPNGLTRTDIYTNIFQGHTSASVIRAKLTQLIEAGMIAEFRIRTDGAPRTIFRIQEPS
jgi:hypothetical protein